MATGLHNAHNHFFVFFSLTYKGDLHNNSDCEQASFNHISGLEKLKVLACCELCTNSLYEQPDDFPRNV